MATKVFVNLPVKDLDNSLTFFKILGFSFDKKFMDESSACMSLTDDTYVMLLSEEKFRIFTPKEICDSEKFTEVMLCLSLDSRKAVDDMVSKAVSAGGSTYNDPQDYGFMYGHGFQDLNGHIWEVIYMPPSSITQG